MYLLAAVRLTWWQYPERMLQCMSSSVRAVLLTAIAAVPVLAQTGTSSWNRYRGPNGTGLADGTYPAEVGPDQGVIWKRAFPEGHSSPVFSDKLMFLKEVEDD